MATTIVFSKNNCSQCDATKADLKALNVEFDEINLDDNPSYLPTLKEKGFRSAPVVMTPEASWAGYNKEKIQEVFGNKA